MSKYLSNNTVLNIVLLSGGKDSTALILFCKEQKVPNLVFVSNETHNEHPETIAYRAWQNERLLGGALILTDSIGLDNLIQKKGSTPSGANQFCTTELKLEPTRQYLQSLEFDFELWRGIRRDESGDRRNAPKRLFSDYYDCWVNNPLVDWTVADVFAIHDKYGIPANPLYSKGFSRVGCFPCVNWGLREVKATLAFYPEEWERIEERERINGRSFFGPKFIPKRFQTGRTKDGKSFPWASDVKRYVQGDPNALNIFDIDPPKCASIYGLCDNPFPPSNDTQTTP